jgi:hypothetical protein
MQKISPEKCESFGFLRIMCVECGENLTWHHSYRSGITATAVSSLHYWLMLDEMPKVISGYCSGDIRGLGMSWFPMGSIYLRVNNFGIFGWVHVFGAIFFFFFQSKYRIWLPFITDVEFPDTGNKIPIIRPFSSPRTTTKVNALVPLKNFILIAAESLEASVIGRVNLCRGYQSYSTIALGSPTSNHSHIQHGAWLAHSLLPVAVHP